MCTQCEEAAPGPVEAQQQSSSRQRLEQFKSRAKRSLTESLEGIWKVTQFFLSSFLCSYAQVGFCIEVTSCFMRKQKVDIIDFWSFHFERLI